MRDETVGKPLNLIRDWGLRGESCHDIGKGGTLSKYGDSLDLVATLLVLSRCFDGPGKLGGGTATDWVPSGHLTPVVQETQGMVA